MHLKIGNTKLLTCKYSVKGLAKLEINFKYLFLSHKGDRRFANVLVDLESQELKIKVKSEFSNSSDCEKLSRLLIGIDKIITSENIAMIDKIIDGKSDVKPQDFLKAQEEIIKYFL